MCTNKSGRLQSSDRRQALSCVNDNIVFSCLHVVEGMWFFHHILTQPGAQCSAEPCTSYYEIWSCIIPPGPIFCQGYLTDMKWVDAKQSKEGLTYELTLMLYHRHLQHPINILPTQHPPHTLSTVHMFWVVIFIVMGNILVLSGIVVGKEWDQNYVGFMLTIGC